MQSKGFNSRLKPIVCGLLFFLGGHEAQASGIPVVDILLIQTTSQGTASVVTAIQAQTKALADSMDYVMRTSQKLSLARDTALEKTKEMVRNSYAMEPSLGAKPRSACGQLGAASIRAVANDSHEAVLKIVTKGTKAHSEVSRSLAPNEPRKDYNIDQVIKVLDDETVDEYGRVVMSNDPIDPNDSAALSKARTIQLMLLNPFPVETPSEADIERIKATGSPGEKQSLAQSIALQRRQEVAQFVHDQEFARNIQNLDTSSIEYMITDIEKYLSSDQKAMLDGKISQNQLDELLATYRVLSPDWIKQATTSPSPEMVQREQMLMQAEMLNQMWEIRKNLTQISKIISFGEARTISQNGLQSK